MLPEPSAGPRFDPFLVAPIVSGTSSWRSRRLLLLVPLIAVVATCVAVVEGTIGTSGDFQLWADFKRVAGLGSVVPAPPRFPLLRDYPSWFLSALIAFTCVLVHRQWRVMCECLPGLRHQEVLRPRSDPAFSRMHHVLGLPRVTGASSDRLTTLVDWINHRVLSRLARYNVLVAFLAVLLVSLLVLGQNRTGIFEVIAPSGQTHGQREAWLNQTYASWWASTHHLGGVLVYSAIATLGIYVILLQNLIGFLCVYLCIAIPVLEEPDVDWGNDDGRYGWRPLASVYQTVTWSVVLHGLGLSLLLFVLGVENFKWVLVLWALWVTIIPLYMVLPRLVFRRVASEARRRRLELIAYTLETGRTGDPKADVELEDWAAHHRRITEDAVIRPLRMRRFEVAPLVIGIIFPVVLAVAQIVFSIEFGPGN